MKTDANQGILLHSVVGPMDAFLGRLLISPLLGVGTLNQITSETINVAAMGVFLIGAIILLALINLVRRGSVR